MHPLKKLYCRTFQTVFKLAIPFLPYRSPELLHGMDELIDKLKALKLNHVLLVTDKGIRSLGSQAILNSLWSKTIFSAPYMTALLPTLPRTMSRRLWIHIRKTAARP